MREKIAAEGCCGVPDAVKGGGPRGDAINGITAVYTVLLLLYCTGINTTALHKLWAGTTAVKLFC